MTEAPAPYGKPVPDTRIPLARVFEAAECRTQSELAEFLSIRQSSISDAKRRGAVPAEWLLKLLLLKGVNPVWVLTGQGSRWLQPAEQLPVLLPLSASGDVCTPEGFSTEVLLKELLRRALHTQR